MIKPMKEKRIAVIGDEQLISLAKLAGVKLLYIVKDKDPNKLRNVLENILRDKEIGLVLVNRYVIDLLGDYGKELMELTYPTVIVVPSFKELKDFKIKEFYLRKARRALGVSIHV